MTSERATRFLLDAPLPAAAAASGAAATAAAAALAAGAGAAAAAAPAAPAATAAAPCLGSARNACCGSTCSPATAPGRQGHRTADADAADGAGSDTLLQLRAQLQVSHASGTRRQHHVRQRCKHHAGRHCGRRCCPCCARACCTGAGSTGNSAFSSCNGSCPHTWFGLGCH